MSHDDEAGAVAAATYFLTDLYEYTVISHDTSTWLGMSHSLCTYCESISSSVKTEADEGSATTPGRISVVATRSEAFSALAFGASLDIHIGPTIKLSMNGEVIGERSEANATMAAVMVWQDDQWLVRGVDVLPFGTGA
jgi:hypothetical protein